MVRTTSQDKIGERVKVLRQKRGWSIRQAADRAGLAHTTWGRIERGEMSADNRFTLAAIATALEVSQSVLTDVPVTAIEADQVDTGGAAYRTMQAVIDADLDYSTPTVPIGPIAPLVDELELVYDLRARCDYLGAAKRLPELVRGLHAATHGPDRADALRGLALADEAASFLVRYLGHPASSALIADRTRQAAVMSEDRVIIGLAAYSQAHAATGCGLYPRALTIAERAVDELLPHTTLPNSLEMLGQLYLTVAFAKYALGDTTAAIDAVSEAGKIAERTGQSEALHLSFGPTNINFWLVSMHSDSGDPGKAVELARQVSPQEVASVSRQAAFYLDTGRALANLGQVDDALRMLLLAERLAPQRVRRSPIVAETARGLLERARRHGNWSQLHGFCERVGVQP